MVTLSQAVFITLGVFLLMLVIKWANDYYAKNYTHRIINHGFSAYMDLIIYAVVSSYLFNDVLLYNNWIVLLAVAILSSLRWLLFDIMFNVSNGNTLMHVGKSAMLDKMMQPFSELIRLFIKLFISSSLIILFVMVVR